MWETKNGSSGGGDGGGGSGRDWIEIYEKTGRGEAETREIRPKRGGGTEGRDGMREWTNEQQVWVRSAQRYAHLHLQVVIKKTASPLSLSSFNEQGQRSWAERGEGSLANRTKIYFIICHQRRKNIRLKMKKKKKKRTEPGEETRGGSCSIVARSPLSHRWPESPSPLRSHTTDRVVNPDDWSTCDSVAGRSPCPLVLWWRVAIRCSLGEWKEAKFTN